MSTQTELRDLIHAIGTRPRSSAVNLSGGGTTDVYLDVKGILHATAAMNLAANAVLELLYDIDVLDYMSAIGGPTMGADVLSHTIAAHWPCPYNSLGMRWFSVRDQPKTTHGLMRMIEGTELDATDTVVIVDDVASTGNSLMSACAAVHATGAQIRAVVPLVDRGDACAQRFADIEIPYYPVLSYHDLGIPPLVAI